MKKYKYYLIFLSIIITSVIVLIFINNFEFGLETINTNEHLTELENFIEDNPGSVDENIDLIYLYKENGDLKKSLNLAIKLSKEQDSFISYHTLANVYTWDSQFSNALKAREKAVSIERSSDSLIYYSNNLLTSDIDNAIKTLKEAISLEEVDISEDKRLDIFNTYLVDLDNFNEELKHDKVAAVKDFVKSDYIFFDEIKVYLIEKIMNDNVKELNTEEISELKKLRDSYK